VSVSISRFVRVMANEVVGKPVVNKLDAKVTARIGELQKLADELKRLGEAAPEIQNNLATLQKAQTAALQNPNLVVKLEMLEAAKAAAKRGIATGEKRVFDAVSKQWDTALADLAAANASIPDMYLRRIAVGKMVDLREQAKTLRDTTDKNPALAKDVLDEIGNAATWTADAIEFGTHGKSSRDEYRADAAIYKRAGKKLAEQEDAPNKDQGAKIVALADELVAQVEICEDIAKQDPKKASKALDEVYNKYQIAVSVLYTTEIVEPKTEAARSLAVKIIATNPDSPEAKLQGVLKEEFDTRLTEVYAKAWKSGAPEINSLTPGEAVALYTWTTEDYKGMNALLMSGAKPQNEGSRNIQIKVEEAIKALAKLPPYPVSPTGRGEGRWGEEEGDDLKGKDVDQYTQGHEFAVKTFWATGVGFSFPGFWQITVFGKSGKNIKPLSQHTDESEILFAPGTKFRVKSVKLSKDRGDVVVEEI
jgi:hypothetical protein